MNHDELKRSRSWREWEKQNCKLTLASFLVFVTPLIWMLMLDHFWKIATSLTMPIGIVSSKPGWRRWLGAVLFVVFLIFWRSGHTSGSGYLPGQDGFSASLLLFWLAAFYWTWYRDGQEHKRLKQKRSWER